MQSFITHLQQLHARNIMYRVSPNIFQSHDDLEANLQQDEAQDEKNIDEWNGDLPPNESNVY